jgi:uncharacterized protein (TIGR02118 family)
MSEQRRPEGTEPSSTRREFIGGAGTAAAAALVAAPTGVARAVESQVGQECMTIVYENGDDVRFDFDYYESTHMPLIMRLYGESISRFELRRGEPAADGTPPPYVATLNIYIADAAAFDAAAAEHQAGIRADVDKFTNARLIAQRDRVVAIAE